MVVQQITVIHIEIDIKKIDMIMRIKEKGFY